METNEQAYERIKKNAEKLFLNEKYRKEQHGGLRIIFNREGTPCGCLRMFRTKPC